MYYKNHNLKDIIYTLPDELKLEIMSQDEKAKEIYTDDLLYIMSEHNDILDQFSEFVKFLSRNSYKPVN